MDALNRNLLLTLAGVLLAVTALIIGRGPREALLSPSTVIVEDVSRSAQRVCDCITGLGRQTISANETGEGSRLSLLTTGDAANDNHPVHRVSFPIPKLKRVFEGREAFAQEQQQLLKALTQACLQAQPTDATPLFQTIKAAAELLNQFDLKGRGLHTIHITSDGQETEEAGLEAALKGQPLGRVKLPPAINNHQIKIVFHGLAQTAGREQNAGRHPRQLSGKRTAADADRLREIWKMMFTNPQLVSFEPFCSTNPDTASSAPLSH